MNNSYLKFNKSTLWLILISLLAIFFYTYRLDQTFVMAGDTSRDLLRVMEIWKNKEITMIGPPVNTISNNPIKVYFGSMYYYFGLLGILLVNLNPAGSVLVNIFLIIVSLPFFYVLAKDFLRKPSLSLCATFIYSLSPLTVALARSYWNPNFVIPLSVLVWYLLIKHKRLWGYFASGTLTGVILNLHYMNIIPIGIYIIFLCFKKEFKKVMLFTFGFVLALTPLIAFEIKNHFFLIKAFLNSTGGFSTFSQRTYNPFISFDAVGYIFGLAPSQYFIPGLFNISFNQRIIINSLVGTLIVTTLIIKKTLKFRLIGVVIVGLLMSWYFETWHLIGVRYILSVYPLLIIYMVAFIFSIRPQFLIFFLATPMLLLSSQIINHKLDPLSRDDYYPIVTIEKISKLILEDNPQGKYNITENILGDSRSVALRYFLTRDANIKPQPVENYSDIELLYVISSSVEKTYRDNTWEFSSSGPKKIVWEKSVGDLKLFKFQKI